MEDQRCVLCVQHHEAGVDCHDGSNTVNSSIFPNSQDSIVDLSICNGTLNWSRKVRRRVGFRSIQRSNRVTICNIVRLEI